MQNNFEPMLDSNDFSDYCVLLVEDDEIMRLSLGRQTTPWKISQCTPYVIQPVPEKSLRKVMSILLSPISACPMAQGLELFTDMSRRFPGNPSDPHDSLW